MLQVIFKAFLLQLQLSIKEAVIASLKNPTVIEQSSL